MSTFDGSKFQALKDAIGTPSVYCAGTMAVPINDLTMFYGKDARSLGRVNFSNASEAELEHLARACDPATFGVNQKDVLDESYRKAGKIDTENFSAKFNLERSGLIDVVRFELLEGHDGKKPIEAELYKLNVYGKDSFFKSHKDTPRGDRMFGSLVIVFPTPHEGGALMLRHGGKEWTFDSGKQLSGQERPSIGYVAFYSDVVHEVIKVQSGHRVTLTYNLYFAPESITEPVVPTPSANELAFKAALSTLLGDGSVLPNGGNLGFGLRHAYPVNTKTNLNDLIGCLKGSDSLIGRVCSQLSLEVSLKVMYRDDYNDVDIMTNKFANLQGAYMDESLSCELVGYEYGGRVVRSLGGSESDSDPDSEPAKNHVDVFWVTEMTTITSVKEEYIAYGNEAELAFAYGNICLIVGVGPYGKREKV